MKDTVFFRKLSAKPKKILVCRTDRIGDLVSSLPVFEVLSNQLGLEVQVLCSPLTLPLLENNPYVDLAHAYRPELEPHLIKQLGLAQFDALLVLVNDVVALRVIRQLRQIPVRMGPVSKPSAWFQYNYPALQKRSRSIKNEAEYNLDLLKQFGFDGEVQPKPALYFQEKETLGFQERLETFPAQFRQQGYMVLHAGMSGSALNWPVESYQGLLKWAVGQGIQVALTGTGDTENQQVEALRSHLSTEEQVSTLNLVGQLSLRELGLLCRFSRLFVGPSTGPTHIAGAVDVPVVSFYPPILVQSETRWAPFKANANVLTPEVKCPVDRKCKGELCDHFGCMGLISLEQVQQACLDMMRINPLRS